jgi:surfeit locus 1 family protein
LAAGSIRVPRSITVFVTLAVVLSALFVRLGFWQLARLGERRAINAITAARLAHGETPFKELRHEAEPALRRTMLVGIPDAANEFMITGRSRDGSPGVHIVTPVRVPGSDTAVLVNRGWVYAADAATADLARWREPRAEFHGYSLQLPASGLPPVVKGRSLRPFGIEGVRKLVPYPVRDLYLVSQDSQSDQTPARLPMPALDEGPHMAYAIQWFSFAAIALVGAAIVIRRERLVASH